MPPRRPTKNWRERLGLQEHAPGPDEWVPVISGRVDNQETGFSGDAARAAQLLAVAGIDAQQRPYALPDTTGFQQLPGAIPDAATRIRIAVVVHQRDLERAKDVLRPHMPSDGSEPEPISDDELARLSEEAGRLTDEQGA